MSRPRWMPFVATIVAAAAAQAAHIDVTCVQGCLAVGDDQTLGLLRRATDADGLMLRWSTSENPLPPGGAIRLFAGDPERTDAIPDRGQLSFASEGGIWSATAMFPGGELGRGTFLAVVVASRDGRETILDWRVFRLAVGGDVGEVGSPPGSAWSVDVRPSLLQVRSGHGDLPRARERERPVWWSLAALEGEATDVDLDGEATGAPGLSIKVSAPWPAGAGGGSLIDEVRDRLTGVEGHTVRFNEMEWHEQPERTVELSDGESAILRAYYTIATLYTQASVKTFDEREVGGHALFISPTYFAHETSARLKHTSDPRFWASYSRRDLGADAHLLDLLERQTRNEGGTVPGLPPIHKDDGDGGSVTYRAGFTAWVRPWEDPAATPGRRFRAGFVGVDVVAARAGYGGVLTQGGAGRTEIESVLCRLLGCEGSTPIDLDKPPAGYHVAQPEAALHTVSGSLAMLEGKPLLARRDTVNLPDTTRFSLAAGLRAGALIRKGRLGYAANLVPINAYAQFVIKMTVAMVPDANLVSNEEPIMPKPEELSVATALPKPTGFLAWLRNHWIALTGIVGAVALVVLLLAVPGLGAWLAALFRRR